MLAKFILTATVLAGWTIAQPSTPPRPLVAKTTGFDSGGGARGDDELIVGKWSVSDSGTVYGFPVRLCLVPTQLGWK